MDPGTDNRKREHDELNLLYQISAADLAYFKQQQWSLANYALLLYAALVGAAKLLPTPLRPNEPIVLSVLVMLAGVASSIVLWKLEAAIEIRRSRLLAVRNAFSEAFNRAWGAEGKRDELVSVAWLLQSAVVLGGAVSLWVLVRQ